VDKVDRIDQYACKGCTKAGLGETTYKRHNVGAETPVDDVENDSDDTKALVPNSRKRKVASQRVRKLKTRKQVKQSASGLHKPLASGPATHDATPHQDDNIAKEVGPDASISSNAPHDLTTDAAGPGTLEFLRAIPEFHVLREAIRQDPHVLEIALERIQSIDPRFTQMIFENQEQLVFLLNETTDEEGSHTINGKAVPQDPGLSKYQQIADKLSMNVELVAGYNSTDQTGNVLEFNPNNYQWRQEIELRITTICERHRAIYAQMGLMKVMNLDEADFAIIREDPQAVEEFFSVHLDRLVNVQNGELQTLLVQ
jgi:hypothetical protein